MKCINKIFLPLLMRQLIVLLTCLMFLESSGQDTVTVAKRDTVLVADTAMALAPLISTPIESLFAIPPYPSVYGNNVGGFLRSDERFKPTKPVIRVRELRRSTPGVEWMFYLFCGDRKSVV